MASTTGWRKVGLTAHLVASIGWFGAVAGFLSLAIVGLSSKDAQMVRAVYLGMDLTGWYVIVPMCIASFITGVIQSLGTSWGLLRHFWVVAKLVMTIPATFLLLLHMQPIDQLAHLAAESTLSPNDLSGFRIQVVVQSVAALVVLIVAR